MGCRALYIAYLNQRRQVEEEWWAGAVALDHFLIGLPDLVSELTAATSTKQHQWKAWIVNTQSSAQLGSHWLPVVVGAAVQNSAQLLQSTATSSTAGGMLELSQPLQSIGTHADPITNNYANLFESPDPDLSNALHWAHANAMHPHVAAWLHACSQWDSAVATKEHERRDKRRKLCKEHDIPLTKIVDTNKELETAMEYIRRQLTNRITDIRANKLDNYFKPRAAGDACSDIEKLRIPDVATDVSSTYLRLHAKRHIYAEDEDFRIVTNTLSQLRGFVNKKSLHDMTTDPPKTSKTIRQAFKERICRTVHFDVSKSDDKATDASEGKAPRFTINCSHTWRTYYVKLLVLAQARRWLSATEQLHPIADAPSTPKTNFQLAGSIKHPEKTEYVPFGGDFEDADANGPVDSRLPLYAEIHKYSDHA